MKISIAMATYNGAKYLQEQLDSFLVQTLQPDELVVCDDGSTDDTEVILRRFREQAPFPVKIYRNLKNLGHVITFEKALELCTGEMIFLSDQDDVWFPEKLDKMVEFSNCHKKISVFVNDMIITDDCLSPAKVTQLSNHLDFGFRLDAFGPGCGMAIRRYFLDVILPIPADLPGHDSWINNLSTALKSKKITRRPLQYYRRHENATSSSITSGTARVSILATLRKHRLIDARQGWRAEAKILALVAERLVARQDYLLNYFSSACIDDARSMQAIKIRDIDRRIRIRESSFPFKQFRIMTFWLNGGYKSFLGWKSALKDLIS